MRIVMTRIVAALAMHASLACASSPDVAVTRGSQQYVPLAIGESADLVVRFANNEATRLDSVRIEIETGLFAHDTHRIYLVELASQATCSDLQSEGPSRPTQYLFRVGPIDPQHTVACEFRITRPETATNSTEFDFNVYDPNSFDFNQRHDGAAFQLGSFTDVALSADQMAFSLDSAGYAHSVLRLAATNRGPADVGAIRLVACTDNFSLPFAIESNFPGGCGVDTGALCFDSGFGFTLSPLAADKSESCDLKLTGVTPYQGREDFPFMRIEQDMPDPATGGTLIDTNWNDDWVDLYQDAAVKQPAPAASRTAQLLLALAIIALAVPWLRTSTRQHGVRYR
jgi:hypothetical protein